MLSFLLKRILSALPAAIAVVVIVSTLIHIIPGDAVDSIAGEYATMETKQALRHSLGLDQPISMQILGYLKNIAKGQLGNSLLSNRPVSELIDERVSATIELAFSGMAVAILISIPLGILAALHARKFIDYASVVIALIGISMPTFWLGPLLIMIFALNLGWLPVSERGDWLTYILPSVTLGLALASILTRMTRNSVLEVLREDYIRTARAKGISEFLVIAKHVLRNAALPIITIISLQFGTLLTGAVITEKIFDWPGLGTLMLDALGNRDYPVVQGCVLVFSITYIFVNIVTDILYALVDPRIKIGS